MQTAYVVRRTPLRPIPVRRIWAVQDVALVGAFWMTDQVKVLGRMIPLVSVTKNPPPTTVLPAGQVAVAVNVWPRLMIVDCCCAVTWVGATDGP